MTKYKLLESYVCELDGMIDQQSPPPPPPAPNAEKGKGWILPWKAKKKMGKVQSYKTQLAHTKIRMSHARRLAKLRGKLAQAKTQEARAKIQSSINLLQTWYSNKIRQLS